MKKSDPVTIGDKTRPAGEWARQNAIDWTTVQQRIRRGFSPARAVTERLSSKAEAGRRGAAASPWRSQLVCNPSWRPSGCE